MNNINIQVYSSCNCNCSFCKFTDSCHQKINPEYVLNYINKHPEINTILLTGGEPTFAIEEYKEIMEGLDIKEKKVVLQTNGWWGDSEYVKQIIKDNPPTIVHLSVDYEKQKFIPIETALKSYEFLNENNIETAVVNHHNQDEEFGYYKSTFPRVVNGRICVDDGVNLYDCGTALLADNTEGVLNIKGWCSNGL